MMDLIVLESPYAGDSAKEVAANVAYAVQCLRDCLLRGEAPFASHLLYPQALDDRIPHERALGIKAGLDWGSKAARTAVYIDRGVSPGMRLGIDRARAEGRPVEFRSLYRSPSRICQECGEPCLQAGCVLCADKA